MILHSQHSIKIEETAKGIRVATHVYGNNEEDTISSALGTYEKSLAKFKESGHVMAVMNGEHNETRL